MIRVQRATPARPATTPSDDVPDDPVMRLVEIGLAVLAVAAALVLALLR
jgi:hypothetical protein